MAWIDDLRGMKERHAIRNEPHHYGPEDGPVNAYEFADVLSDMLHGGETVIADDGTAFYVMGQAFRCKEGQRYITCGSTAAMGWTMPAMTGAAFAAPERMIVGVTGDGSFMTNVHELAVWRCHGLNCKLFILDNGGYLSIRNTQDKFFGERIGTDTTNGLWFPRFVNVCHSYEIAHVTTYDRLGLQEAIRQTLSRSGPVVCRISCQPAQKLMPQVESRRDEGGKIVSGRLDEMVPVLR